MPITPFEFQDDLSELVQQVQRRLTNSGIDPESLNMVGLSTLAVIFKNRDDDLETYLNDDLNAAVHQVAATAGTAVTSGTPVAVTWEAEPVDTSGDAAWDAGADPTRVTYSEGFWVVTANLAWAATATGARGFEFRKNGTAFTPTVGASAPASTVVTPLNSATVHLVAAGGDYLEVWANQDSGADKTVTGTLESVYLGSVG